MDLRLFNQVWTCALASSGDLRLDALAWSGAADVPLLRAGAPLAMFIANDVVLHPTLVEQPAPDALDAAWSGNGVQGSLRLRLDGDRLRWTIELQGDNQPVTIRFPFLSSVGWGTDGEHTDVYDAAALQDATGRSLFRHADWPLPAVWTNPEGQTLTLLGGPVQGGRATLAELARTGMTVTAPGEPSVVWDAELVVHAGGWAAAWDRFRQRLRPSFDLSQYRRPDTRWYDDQLVQHFTFLYGREILNLDTGTFEIDRFLDEGERAFGGYDGMLIWGVYPRIGIDERTQWDFHDDLPGGRDGLRAMARRARERGVRFFVPYKPWDNAAELRGTPDPVPDHEQLARLVADVEADGVFLDTMAAISPEFRAALDAARPGVVFCSEGRAKGRAFEMITGAWEQSPNRDAAAGNWAASIESMPAVDVWRFVFPEHRLFVINRHSMGEDRIRIIQRGFFGGMGWVVWQDIFGLTLPYTTDEAALLKRCRTILREHRQALWSATPTPLIRTSDPQVFCNEFPGTAKRLWTLYNAGTEPVSASLPEVVVRAGHHLVDLWNDQEAELDDHDCPLIDVQPHALGALAELPVLLDQLDDGRTVQLREPIEGAVLDIRQAGVSQQQAAPDTPLRLPSGQGRCVVRLLLDGEVLDQIVVSSASGAAV